MSLSLVGLTVTAIINEHNPTDEMVWYFNFDRDHPYLLKIHHVPEDAISLGEDSEFWTNDGRKVYADKDCIYHN